MMTNPDGVLMDDKIEEIFDLQTLKKFACPKNQHKKEWYMECVECKSKERCKAGKQALFILNNETAPSQKESAVTISAKKPKEELVVSLQEKKKRDMVEAIFSSQDPVRKLLESCDCMKAQSVYNKVNSWRKSFPDLQEKYHMLEKVRFLWTHPYDQMRVPDILKMMYPEPEKKEEAPVMSPVKKEETEDISLEDYLNEFPEEEPVEEKLINEKDILHKRFQDLAKESPRPKNNLPITPKDIVQNMQSFVEKLRNEKDLLQKRMQELDEQLKAFYTVGAAMGIHFPEEK